MLPHTIAFGPSLGFVPVPKMQKNCQGKHDYKKDPEKPGSPKEVNKQAQYNILCYPEPDWLRMPGKCNLQFSFYNFIERHSDNVVNSQNYISYWSS